MGWWGIELGLAPYKVSALPDVTITTVPRKVSSL